MGQVWEVEQKFVVHSMDSLLNALHGEGFVEREVEQHSDTYFRHPSRDFRATDEALRLRQKNDTACVTYKGKRREGPVKTRPEIELQVMANEQAAWGSMLEQLGFRPLPAVRKMRRTFGVAREGAATDHPSGLFDGIVVAVDDVEQLGAFAEIELLVSEESQLAAAQKRIMTVAGRLGLSDVQPRSYLSQLLAKLDEE